MALLLAACGPAMLPTPAVTPAPAFVLSGIVFFDRNGNGARDDGEPAIPDATIQVGGLVATTAADGSYAVRGVTGGEQSVRLSAPGFRHVSLSSNAAQSIDEPVNLVVDGDTRRHFGLTQGFLTLPFRCCPPFTIKAPLGMSVMFDVDRRIGYVRSYDPQRIGSDTRPGHEGSDLVVCDQHEGIDYCFPMGTDIVAAAPGVVSKVDVNASAGDYVVIDHPYAGIQTLYAHLSQILVNAGQPVARGQLVARSGASGMAGEPHLHFGCYATWKSPVVPMDPYRDLTDPASKSRWTVDNRPQYPR